MKINLPSQKEIYEINKANKWHDEEVEDEVALILVRNEAHEALNAWREDNIYEKKHCLAEELADIVIRLLDYAEDKGYECNLCEYDYIKYSLNYQKLSMVKFVKKIEKSTQYIEIMLADYLMSHIEDFVEKEIKNMIIVTYFFADQYKINLNEEVRKKIEYNKTRGYKHGNKKI